MEDYSFLPSYLDYCLHKQEAVLGGIYNSPEQNTTHCAWDDGKTKENKYTPLTTTGVMTFIFLTTR
jgi:hypothetical protein